MATARSAGLVVFRTTADTGIEVLLGHMGGPFWTRRDQGAWTIPKGEPGPDEELEQAARREFTEELGLPVPSGPLLELGEVRQSGGKRVVAWAVEGDPDLDRFSPGTFEMTWPPRSGQQATFPELDRIGWFRIEKAADRIVTGQRELLRRLEDLLA